LTSCRSLLESSLLLSFFRLPSSLRLKKSTASWRRAQPFSPTLLNPSRFELPATRARRNRFGKATAPCPYLDTCVSRASCLKNAPKTSAPRPQRRGKPRARKVQPRQVSVAPPSLQPPSPIKRPGRRSGDRTAIQAGPPVLDASSGPGSSPGGIAA
jgi:hypothetical protein